MSFLGRLAALILPGKSVPEGAYHAGPYHIMGPHGGTLPHAWGPNWNFWQMDLDPLPGCGITAMVGPPVGYAEPSRCVPWRTGRASTQRQATRHDIGTSRSRGPR